MEQDQESPAITRGQNQLHIVPDDWTLAAAALTPFVERLDADAAVQGTKFLVITSDAESAAGIASQLGTGQLPAVAATDARRARRMLHSAAPRVLVAPAQVLVELLQSSVLKLDAVRVLALAWVDDLGEPAMAALEAVAAEVPKDAARVVLAGALTPAVEQLVERYARRARRATPAAEPTPPASVSYVTTSEAARTYTLRRLLDTLDPESAFVVVRSPIARTTVQALLQALGYESDAGPIRVGDSNLAEAGLIILYELPESEQALREIAAKHPSSRLIALVTARQLASLRRMAGGTVSPLALPEAALRARGQEDVMRDELRAVLASGAFARELLALEPLLAEYDGVEIAAAALRLLESGRAATSASPPATAAPAALTRLYLNTGSSDNVRPGDLVGAIMHEAGIGKAEIGRVDVRERHSTVEVSTALANQVVSRLTGVSIRGRRVVARVDEGPARGGPARPRRAGTRERPPRQ